MKSYFGAWIAPCLLLAGLGVAAPKTAAAQEQAAGITPPPKVAEIITEVIKPGQEGSPHAKTESAFPKAFADAHWQQHYFAMDALSGRGGRTLFFIAYDSLAGMQKDVEGTEKDATLSAALDRARVADGALLQSYDTSAYALRNEISLRAGVKIEEMRYFEITTFNVRSGHRQDWDTLAKGYMSAYEKIPGPHWAAFEKVYGDQNSGARFLLVTPMKSLAEADQEMDDNKQVISILGADQMKKLEDLAATTIESSDTQVYQINPKLSYPPDAWVKADPAFWGQK